MARLSLRAAIDAKHEVDTEGRVFSIARDVPFFGRWGKMEVRRKPEVQRRPQTNGQGYAIVTFGRKRHYVHQLVAKAFVPNPEGHRYVNHIDGNKLNNRAANLEWTTSRQNLRHAMQTGLRRPWVKVGSAEFQTVRAMLASGKSVKEAARAVGVSRDHLSELLRGKYRRESIPLGEDRTEASRFASVAPTPEPETDVGALLGGVFGRNA